MEHEHEFDQRYWDDHWRQVHEGSADAAFPPNPYLVTEVSGLAPGTALEAGCGEGAEAIWLGRAGWRVTAADIAEAPLARAAARAASQGLGDDEIRWVRADLSSWQPSEEFDLVTTHYAHPRMPQLEFYERLSGWVAPGGSLLIVGHLHTDHGASADHHPPVEATVTAASIAERLATSTWDVVTATEQTRLVDVPEGAHVTLHDVVVRAVRRAEPATGEDRPR